MPMAPLGLLLLFFLQKPAIHIVLGDEPGLDLALEFFALRFFLEVLFEALLLDFFALAEQEIQGIEFGIDFDAVGDQKPGRHAQAFDVGMGEVAVIDMSWAARRRILFENRDADAKEFAGFQGGFRAGIELICHIFARDRHDAAFDDFRRLARSRKSARDFGAERDKFVFLRQFLGERERIIRSIVFAFFAHQAGADQDFFHCPVSLLFSIILFYKLSG
jgi:hypothetical protein